MKLRARAATKAIKPELDVKLIGRREPVPDVFEAPLAGDVAVEDELVPVTVVFVTMCVQLSLWGIEKLLLSVTSAHWKRLPSPPLNSTWRVTFEPSPMPGMLSLPISTGMHAAPSPVVWKNGTANGSWTPVDEMLKTLKFVGF